jgi:hypothetical protein
MLSDGMIILRFEIKFGLGKGLAHMMDMPRSELHPIGNFSDKHQ